MGRPCKCRYCQTNTNTDEACMFMIGKLKAYFCNEEHYNLFIKEKEEAKQIKIDEMNATRQKKQEEKALATEKWLTDKNKVYYLICELIGRKKVINTILWKEWAIWNQVANNETIGIYLEENKDYLSSIISKIKDEECSRIKYLSAILKNSLGDYKPKAAAKETIVPKIQDEYYETKFKLKKRRGFEDLEEDCDE